MAGTQGSGGEMSGVHEFFAGSLSRIAGAKAK
jgi:hypothetical protein